VQICAGGAHGRGRLEDTTGGAGGLAARAVPLLEAEGREREADAERA
jgi:hypothetical protein